MRILGLSGSLRRDSYNRKLLRAAAAKLPPGVALVEWDRIPDLPAYNEDLDVEPAPEPVRDLRQAIAAADAVLISTPEYNGSLPGALKNALDWASRPWPEHPLRNKPVAVMGASTGLFGAVWAQGEVRKTLKVLGASVLESELPVGLAEAAFDADGDLVEPGLRAALGALVEELHEQARAPVGQAA